MNLNEALNTGEWVTRSNANCHFYKKNNGKLIFTTEIGKGFTDISTSHLNVHDALAEDWVPVSFDAKQIRIQNLVIRMKLALESYARTIEEIRAS